MDSGRGRNTACRSGPATVSRAWNSQPSSGDVAGRGCALTRNPLGGETEEFGNERPTERYIVGRLAPDGTVIEPDTPPSAAADAHHSRRTRSSAMAGVPRACLTML